METRPGESVVVSLPSSPDHGSEKSAATSSIRQLWSSTFYPIRQLWSIVTDPIIHLCSRVNSCFISELGTAAFGGAHATPLTYIVVVISFLAFIVILPVSSTWKLLKKILSRKPILSWEQIFVISCIAVSVDTFFFYIPIINQENKCLGVDIKLRNTLLVLRSLMDLASVLHIVSQIRDWKIYQNQNSHADTDSYFEPETTSRLLLKLKSTREAIHGRMPWLSVSLMNDFLALLPIPQVAIIIVFFRMGSSNFLLKRTILNVFLIYQYVPRVCQIYLASKKLKPAGIWLKGAFNFFLYVLAGHVLASFWYFFSIQRETSCWHQICRSVTDCISTYRCGESTPKNISLLNELCPINSPNATVFDFGIYLDLLQSGNTESIEFPRKFFYSLWWGIRNLSNFGTNLETSSYVWENCFAILICLFGLLLFLYLIGNVQTYMQLATTKSMKIEEKTEESRRTRINMKYREIKMWMSDKGLSEDLKKSIRECIKQNNIAERYIHVPVDMMYLFRARQPDFDPWGQQNDLAGFVVDELRMNALKKVLPFESDLTRKSYHWVYGNLRPVIYTENSYIIRASEQCDLVVYVVEGVLELTETQPDDPTSTGEALSPMIMTKHLDKGDYFGDELINWALLNHELRYEDCSATRPIWTQDVKCLTKVEAICITAEDLIVLMREAKPTVLPHDNTDETSNQINMPSESRKFEEIEESKQMKMKKMQSNKGRGEPKESVALTGASTSGRTVEQRLEQIIQLQGYMLREQQVLARQIRDDMATQGRRLDGMAAFLDTLGYPDGIPPSPAP